jgi:hypothetical protein
MKSCAVIFGTLLIARSMHNDAPVLQSLLQTRVFCGKRTGINLPLIESGIGTIFIHKSTGPTTTAMYFLTSKLNKLEAVVGPVNLWKLNIHEFVKRSKTMAKRKERVFTVLLTDGTSFKVAAHFITSNTLNLPEQLNFWVKPRWFSRRRRVAWMPLRFIAAVRNEVEPETDWLKKAGVTL